MAKPPRRRRGDFSNRDQPLAGRDANAGLDPRSDVATAGWVSRAFARLPLGPEVRKPKNLWPFQFPPVIALAACERLP